MSDLALTTEGSWGVGRRRSVRLVGPREPLIVSAVGHACGREPLVLGPARVVIALYGPDQGPWHTIEDVELATLGWVHWYNTQRIHGYTGDIPPAEYEAIYHAERSIKQPLGNQNIESPSNPG